ncbi:MAG: penicillin-binding protein 2 [Actinobacteria bacterium]|nr:penicillin-binding protein 2 [Actinomycetota bacterium]
MNLPLRRLGTVIGVMLIALMLSTTSIQFFQAPGLNSDSRNVRTIYREFGRDRGPIIVGEESVAWSVPIDDVYAFQRVYDPGSLYAHVTGYFSTAFNASTGIERWSNDVLGGTADSLLLSRIQDLFTGRQPQGGSVELTIDPGLQQVAADALAGQRGAVVALDPATGAILALHSSPSFDPNALATHDREAATNAWEALLDDPEKPLENRGTGTILYPPGSTFKVLVTAAWLELDPSRDTTSVVPTPAELQLPQSTSIVRNPGRTNCGGSDTGELVFAFKESCNTTFAQLAMDLGEQQLAAMTADFGFDQPLNVPLTVNPSIYPDTASDAEVALTGIGQFDVRVSVIQMAMVAAAVANDGRLMQPYLVATERDADLAVISRTEPEVFSEPISAETASELTALMTAVVESGTGTPAQVGGVTVAGKTGTAETGNEQDQHAWMIAFAPAEDPQVAVAVLLENGGRDGSAAYGGSSAGPIVRRLVEAAVR